MAGLPVGRDINLQDGSIRHTVVDLVGSDLADSHLLGGGLQTEDKAD
jgi:hypothetical protein